LPDLATALRRLHQRRRDVGETTDFSETITYDAFSQPDVVTAVLPYESGSSKTVVANMGFDAEGRIAEIAYPNVTVKYVYNTQGYLSKYQDGASDTLHEIEDQDAFIGNLVQESFANGFETNNGYDVMGRLTARDTVHATEPDRQDFEYAWRSSGILGNRKRFSMPKEDFTYDVLNRITQTTFNNPPAAQRALVTGYDSLGNLSVISSSIRSDIDH
jgi:hypothetical protein